jgi:formamidopyrimidine-DNA glycosylase
VPELPEVEVVRSGLAAHLAGRTISSVEVIGTLGRRSVRRHLAGPADFAAVLAGRTVREVRRRGKYLWWVLDGGDAVLAHLGMSGQFRVGGGEPDAGDAGHPHLRVRLHLTDGGPPVDFLDQRTFGGLSFVPGGADLPAPIAHIARDLLDPEFDRAAAVRSIRGRRTVIKRALLDQTVVSGIGNIYADEALWAARVHYDRATASLAPRTVGGVLDAAADVMRRALAAGGTSFDALYVDVNGESGYFERSLDAYGRAGLPCRRCGTAIRREPFMNRSSFFCPRCQRRPRPVR